MNTTNSVKQIVDACNEMLEHCTDVEHLNIKALSETLEAEKTALWKLFDEHPEDTYQINLKKTEVEELALRVEFYLNANYRLYESRRTLRAHAQKLYNFSKAKVTYLTKAGKESEDELFRWVERNRWALQFLARAQHIVFEELDSDKVHKAAIEYAIFVEGGKVTNG